MQEYAADLQPIFADIVQGFADTLPLFRHLFTEELFYLKLETVSKHILGSDFTFDSHNAEADVLTLQTTLNKCTRSYQLTDHSFLASPVLQQIKRDKCLNTNIISLLPLIDEHVCGRATVRKIAASGLALNHLKLAYSRSGQTGLQLIFGTEIKII